MQNESNTPVTGGQTLRQPQHIRDDIAQELTMVVFYAGSGAYHAAIGYDSGLSYTVQRLIDNVRAAGHQHRLLRERKAANAEWWDVYGDEYLKGGRAKA